MNILVVNQNFTQGGLETHIKTLYDALIPNNKITFCFGHYDSKITFPDSKVYEGFHFTGDITINDFIEDVERLTEIIKNEQIDVIHVHPFYSLYSAMIAANITNTKLVYTYHGVGSFNFYENINDSILFQYGLESAITKVFVVNKSGIKAFESLNYHNIVWLPNSIDTDKFSLNKVMPNGKWAMASRLDADKIPEIEKTIAIFSNTNIKELDIYGDGNSKELIVKWVNNQLLPFTVCFKGFSNNLKDDLNNNYNGIAGSGRTALEGLSMGYPVLLTGNDHVCGLIDLELYNKIKENNFIINSFAIDYNDKEIVDSINDINHNLKKYNLSDYIKKEFNSNKISSELIKEMTSTNFIHFDSLINFYQNLEQLENKKLPFYSSEEVFKLLQNNIEASTYNINLKNYFTLANKIYFETQKKQNELVKENEKLNKKITLLENDFQSEKTGNMVKFADVNKRFDYFGLKQIIKNDFKKLVNKINIFLGK
jgi:hypothetical protein